MTVAPTTLRPVRRSRRGRAAHLVRGTARRLAYCVLLLPVAVAALAAVLVGRPGASVGWWRTLHARLLGVPPLPADGAPSWWRTAGHALLSLLLGAAALIPVALVLLFVFRGVLYGVVDPGPYTTAWGGPTRGGAWLVHFLVGVPIVAGGLAMAVAIVAVHRRLTAGLDGLRAGRWVVPVALLLALASAALVFAWSRQF